jgi:hypothetical protein
VLLDFSVQGKSVIDWQSLSEAFFEKYRQRLTIENPMPQQSNTGRLTVMERIIRAHQAPGGITRNQAIRRVGEEAFADVIPRFQTIGSNRELVGERFYEAQFGRRVILKDSLGHVIERGTDALREELDARWGLLEGSFLIRHEAEAWALGNSVRQTYLANGYQRRNLTSNIPFLQGYQGDVCFYCGSEIFQGDINVDHVLPRQVVQHDQIWNLVLAHSLCNENKSDRIIASHFIEKLCARNENIVGSSHPWKNQIESQLGTTALKRKKKLEWHYENVKTVLGRDYWGGSPDFNPASDPFHKRLITHLNANRR